MSVRCASCGAAVTGRFCGQCGAPAAAAACPSCGARRAAGARFCDSCGAALAETPPRAPRAASGDGSRADRPLLPLVVAGVAVLAVVVVMLVRSQPAAPATFAEAPFAGAGGGGGGAPPDISMMTPLERFDALYDRVMRASERGDTAEAARFAPMALMAYRNLPEGEVDADARFHAAMIRLHTGDLAGAAALADSILVADRTHLFGYVVRNGVGRFAGDEALVRQSYREFLALADAELRAGRPEYGMHQTMLDSFQRAAREAVGGP